MTGYGQINLRSNVFKIVHIYFFLIIRLDKQDFTIYLGGIQKLRWPNFSHFWSPTYQWLTFSKLFHTFMKGNLYVVDLIILGKRKSLIAKHFVGRSLQIFTLRSRLFYLFRSFHRSYLFFPFIICQREIWIGPQMVHVWDL